MQSPRDVRNTGEGVGVAVECDRGRSATEHAFSARILGRGQPIDLVATIIINVPCIASDKFKLKFEHDKSCTNIDCFHFQDSGRSQYRS